MRFVLTIISLCITSLLFAQQEPSLFLYALLGLFPIPLKDLPDLSTVQMVFIHQRLNQEIDFISVLQNQSDSFLQLFFQNTIALLLAKVPLSHLKRFFALLQRMKLRFLKQCSASTILKQTAL